MQNNTDEIITPRTADAMEDIAQNEYNASLDAIYESWEFSEFCEKEIGKEFTPEQNGSVRRETCRDFLPKFYRTNMETVKKLQKRAAEKHVDCGYITDLSHSEKVYDFVLYTNTGSGIGLHIPNEFFAKGRYKPKEGDKISFIEDKNGVNITFSVRENGKDREIYSIDKNSAEYKQIMDTARQRRSVPRDKLAAKQQYLDEDSQGLSGEKRDIKRLKTQRTHALFSGSLARLREVKTDRGK